MDPDSTEFTARLRPRLATSPLWDFALAIYARPGVEQACLTLQDEHGWDVCELLWRCWLYQQGAQAGALPSQVAAWQREVTQPLRRLRRDLKPQAQADPQVASVRSRIKQAELEAEQQCLQMLMKISLNELAFSPIPARLQGLENVLLSSQQRQKKTQLMAIRSVESQLDPLPAAR
ncbi:TIGR02444 family protein [Halomonas sp. OfavH-34-E]|uniref:TIGR02444 family protein n=1 Tax=Halomonas sp. OfavH-34-E TaxID=2954491 RepID=UPI0020975576|nr:TIGR02444 family protein [Halomonas sp. OfavH-34-E]MCO7216541.1 TIGR02444 family protein [Halomonas sp. OfavH-34-E]